MVAELGHNNMGCPTELSEVRFSQFADGEKGEPVMFRKEFSSAKGINALIISSIYNMSCVDVHRN
jgi:hypothetical protein